MSGSTLVWLKRDLRWRDHAPLGAAAAAGDPALALFIVEPAWLHSPEFDAMHLAFALEALRELRTALAGCGLPLVIQQGEAVMVLEGLRRRHGVTRLFSHEETGPGWSYDRDRAVARWCRSQGVAWRQWPQNGVIRGLKDRRGWAARWSARMNADLSQAAEGFIAPAGIGAVQPDLPGLSDFGVSILPRPTQRGGEAAAWLTLDGFLGERGRNYRQTLSSPLTAQQGCSRLSPHLAFGTISMRGVHQATEARIAQLIDRAGPADRAFAHALRGFAGRLRWHCHFMQKLEDEPAIEFRNFARVYDGLREPHFSAERLAAWSEGRTGYPMVDACMRSLRATGWLNFRMRAMLVSFASYHLWLHWRETGLLLARQFLDFEAGIHWSQMQMQSGTTGINTLRIYSPSKQARDHDPQGVFIRRWLPELGGVPIERLFEPWRMGAAEQQASGCRIGRNYPAPIVDAQAAVLHAQERLYALRRTPEAREQADAVQHKHGSRKSGLPPSGQRGPLRPGRAVVRRPAPEEQQLDLFGEPDGDD